MYSFEVKHCNPLVQPNCLVLIQDRFQPVLTITAPTSERQDVDNKYAVGVKVKKIRGRENISTEAWNVKTLRPGWELEELTHETSVPLKQTGAM